MCTVDDGSEDYRHGTTVVTFAANTTTASFTVAVCDDTATEPDETFTAALTHPTNATLGPAASATGTIVDNDAPPLTPAQQCEALHGPGWAPVLHPDGTPWTDSRGQIVCAMPH